MWSHHVFGFGEMEGGQSIWDVRVKREKGFGKFPRRRGRDDCIPASGDDLDRHWRKAFRKKMRGVFIPGKRGTIGANAISEVWGGHHGHQG